MPIVCKIQIVKPSTWLHRGGWLGQATHESRGRRAAACFPPGASRWLGGQRCVHCGVEDDYYGFLKLGGQKAAAWGMAPRLQICLDRDTPAMHFGLDAPALPSATAATHLPASMTGSLNNCRVMGQQR